MKRSIVKNEKGSAILWASLVLAMLTVFVTAALTVAFGYHARSVQNNDRRQAYFTARSVAEALAGSIAGGGLTSAYLPQTAGDTLTLARVEGLPVAMGEATAEVGRTDEYTARVTASASFGKEDYAYTVDLTAHCISVPAFRSGLYVESVTANTDLNGLDGDLYIYGASTAASPFYLNFPVTGNVYVPNGVLVIGPGGSVGGSVFAQSIACQSTVPPLLAAAVGTMTGVPALTEQETVPADVFASMFDGIYNADGAVPNVSLAGATRIDAAFRAGKVDCGKVYYVEDSAVVGTDGSVQFKVQGSGTVFVVLGDNATLQVSKSVVNKNTQKIVFILGENARLIFNEPSDKDWAMSVYGPDSASLHITGKTNRASVVRGTIAVGTFTSEPAIRMDAGDAAAASGRSNLVPLRWVVSKKELGNP